LCPFPTLCPASSRIFNTARSRPSTTLSACTFSTTGLPLRYAPSLHTLPVCLFCHAVCPHSVVFNIVLHCLCCMLSAAYLTSRHTHCPQVQPYFEPLPLPEQEDFGEIAEVEVIFPSARLLLPGCALTSLIPEIS
jgi:hypothetical protein